MMQKVRGHTLPEGHSAPSACKYTVSGSISPSSSEFFLPFPHGTSSLSVIDEYLGLDGGPPRFPQDFTCPVVLRIPLEPLLISLTGLSPSLAELSNSVQLSTPVPCRGPTTPDEHSCPKGMNAHQASPSLEGGLADSCLRINAFLLNPPRAFALRRGCFALIAFSHQCSPGLACSLFARTTGGISDDFSSYRY